MYLYRVVTVCCSVRQLNEQMNRRRAGIVTLIQSRRAVHESADINNHGAMADDARDFFFRPSVWGVDGNVSIHRLGGEIMEMDGRKRSGTAENVCNNSKNVKGHVFLILKKKT